MILVDTPGTNVILQRQQRLTEEFVPRADLVVFALSSDRPLTESEVYIICLTCHKYLNFLYDICYLHGGAVMNISKLLFVEHYKILLRQQVFARHRPVSRRQYLVILF